MCQFVETDESSYQNFVMMGQPTILLLIALLAACQIAQIKTQNGSVQEETRLLDQYVFQIVETEKR